MPIRRYPDFHFSSFEVDKSRDLKLLYVIRVLRDLANHLTFFFIPLFIFNLGFDGKLWPGSPFNPFQSGMVLIAAYYVLSRITTFLGAIPIAKLIRIVGFKVSIVGAHLLYVVVFWCLRQSTIDPNFLILVAILDGIQINMFWNCFHTLISNKAQKKHVGEDLGLLSFFLKMASVVSPALGGFMIVNYGYESVFLTALGLTIIAAMVAVFIKGKTSISNPSLGELMQWMKTRLFRHQAVAYVGRYINDASLRVWPLYIFLILGSVEKVGYLYSVSLFLSMILSFAVGFYIDHNRNKMKPYFVSGGVLSTLWLIRSSLVSIWSIATVDAIDRLVSSFHWLVFDSAFTKGGKGRKAFSYFIYREMIFSGGAIAFWTVFALFFIFFGEWQALFIFAAVGVLMTLFVRDNVKIGSTK